MAVGRILATLVLMLVPMSAQAGALAVQIEGVRNGKGDLFVAVCSEKAFNTERCELASKLPAADAARPVMFPGMPSGTYAVKVFHDENGNGRMDSDWFGSSTEGFGLSNNPPRNAWKSFDAAAIRLSDQPAKITIVLQYR